MAELKGWIKLHRQIFDNPVVTKSTEHFAIWIYLLCHASSNPSKAIFNGSKVELSPGQLITSRRMISKCTKVSISESKVQRVLNEFECEHQIEQQTASKNRLITILGWDLYQKGEHQSEHQVNTKKFENRTPSEHQVNTKVNIKTDTKQLNENGLNTGSNGDSGDDSDHKVNTSKKCDSSKSEHQMNTKVNTYKEDIKNKRIKNIYSPQNKEFCVAECDPIISLFNSILSDKLPMVDRLSPKRIKAIETLKAENIDFKVLFEKVRSSSYLTGGGSNGWKADFNWIVDLDHAVRILEGAYDDRKKKRSGGFYFENDSYDIKDYENKSMFDE